MENARPEKIAVIDDVREKLEGSDAAVVTEYRGLTVAEMAGLRKSLKALGGDFKVFKNTLVRRAIAETSNEGLADHLEGPTAIAFINGDVSSVAKALRDFAKDNPALVIKGGILEGSTLSASDLNALADLPSREILLARLAGLIASPMQQLASLLKAVPQNFAYGLKALVEAGGGSTEAAAPAEEAPVAEAPAEAEVVAEEEAPAEEAAPEAAEAEVVAEEAAPEEAAAEAEVAEESAE